MLREFTDGGGTDWRVWEVLPSPISGPADADDPLRISLRNTPFANGWLCFESTSEKRRLAPIPPDWEGADEVGLRAMCESAEPVKPPSSQARAMAGQARH